MPEIGTSGLMSGEGKRSRWQSLTPPRPSSTLPMTFGFQFLLGRDECERVGSFGFFTA